MPDPMPIANQTGPLFLRWNNSDAEEACRIARDNESGGGSPVPCPGDDDPEGQVEWRSQLLDLAKEECQQSAGDYYPDRFDSHSGRLVYKTPDGAEEKSPKSYATPEEAWIEEANRSIGGTDTDVATAFLSRYIRLNNEENE